MTSFPARPISLAALAALLLTLAGGCVERILKIQTDPPGALVTVNDEEVGVSPVQVSFLWYGDYELIFRKRGYETLKTSYRIHPPWYQWPPLDLIVETLIPFTIRDEHELPIFALRPAAEPPVEEVVQRAVELRDRAVFEAP
jgi:hypothetical protein